MQIWVCVKIVRVLHFKRNSFSKQKLLTIILKKEIMFLKDFYILFCHCHERNDTCKRNLFFSMSKEKKILKDLRVDQLFSV